MGQNYTQSIKIGQQTGITGTAVQLTGPTLTAEEAVVTVLVASTSSFTYSDATAGVYRTAGLNPQTGLYEKKFPIQNMFSQIWFKSSGSITLQWEALINRRAWANE